MFAPLKEAHRKEMANVAALNKEFDWMHKDIAESSAIRCTRAQNIHNERTNIFALNVTLEHYVMIRANAGQDNELQTRRTGPRRLKGAKPSLVFVA